MLEVEYFIEDRRFIDNLVNKNVARDTPKAKSGIELLTKTCNKLGEDIKKDLDNELEKTKI